MLRTAVIKFILYYFFFLLYSFNFQLRNDEFQDVFAEEVRSGRITEGKDFVEDCQLESDLPMYFSEDYVPTASERMLLYRELDAKIALTINKGLRYGKEILNTKLCKYVPYERYKIVKVNTFIATNIPTNNQIFYDCHLFCDTFSVFPSRYRKIKLTRFLPSCNAISPSVQPK